MNPTAVSVDSDRLRAAAAGVEDRADRLRRLRCTDLDGALAGSAIEKAVPAGAGAPALGDIAAGLLGWAQSARTVADGFAASDADSAARLRR